MTDRRRRLPAVNALLDEARTAGLLAAAPRVVVVDAIRDTLAGARARGGEEPGTGWLDEIRRRLAERERRSLVSVINATGVVLHTNLGRAPLADPAVRACVEATGYSALEYDLDAGERGSRQRHTRRLLSEITGAEDGLVVNNAAAALLLVLNTLAEGGETIVSRGELVEIGGRFRIPEILEKSGSVLVEVGTTNRTRVADYEQAIGARTRCVLKVHRSNFRLTGFVAEATLTELVGLMGSRAVPVVHDVGSGLLLDLSPWGLTNEPLVQETVAAGALAVFSGDKLLGGPQAGIIVGAADHVQQLAANPLARALRPDKVTIAALEATLALYRDPEAARREIPVLAMLTEDPARLRRRARRLARRITGAATLPGDSAVGGGAYPGTSLPTTLVAVPTRSPDTFLAALRRHEPPVIARAGPEAVLLDVRTLRDDQFTAVVHAADAARHDADQH